MTEAINDMDVLFGRGGATNNHAGNKNFRILVSEHQSEYLQARKKEKADISKRIVRLIRSDGGRFLRRDDTSGLWIEVGDKKASEKTSQALREGLDVRAKISGKSPRRHSESSASTHESPVNQKRQRTAYTHESTKSPKTVSINGDAPNMPDLQEELPKLMPSFLYQSAPPDATDFDNVVEI